MNRLILNPFGNQIADFAIPALVRIEYILELFFYYNLRITTSLHKIFINIPCGFFPKPIALITVASPVAISPPAYIPL